jgi:Gluconate 2-dehydrogenase subunit 3
MPDTNKAGRYPGYDVLAKRLTPSWNEKTRQVINARLAVPHTPSFFTEDEFATVIAIAARLVPQRGDRPPIPVPALVDYKLQLGRGDGYRQPGMPRERDAWRRGLRALDAEAQEAHGKRFVELAPSKQDALLRQMQEGTLKNPAWEGMPAKTFFKQRMAHDVVYAYYAHPTSWNEIGWGGPASPRGYVRMGYNERDPWEAAEVKDGDVATAERKNHHVG